MVTKRTGRRAGQARAAQKSGVECRASKSSAKSKQEILPPESPKDWAKKINLAWRKTAESVIETGRLLIECKAAMPGHFLKIVRDRLHFSPDTAQRLMSIAAHPVFSDAAFLRHLPRSYVTLAILAKLPEGRVRSLIEDRTITPEMRGREAEALLPEVHYTTEAVVTKATHATAVAYRQTPSDRTPPLPIKPKPPEPPEEHEEEPATEPASDEQKQEQEPEEPEEKSKLPLSSFSTKLMNTIAVIIKRAKDGDFGVEELDKLATDLTSKGDELGAVVDIRRRIQ